MNEDLSTIKTIKKVNQLFKSEVPINILLDFLETNFIKNDLYFTINKFLYKKTEYNNNIVTFTSILKEYYYASKKKYVERKMNYNNFLTIIRQLCNANNIKYETKLVYDKSSYEIEYIIYF
jgi:hypothetical protein